MRAHQTLKRRRQTTVIEEETHLDIVGNGCAQLCAGFSSKSSTMNSQDANGTDSAYEEPFSHESVHEIRQRIRLMRNLVDPDPTARKKTGKEDYDLTEDAAQKGRRQSMDTGGFLSFTFGFILFLIVAVGFYAFRNLYQAVVKRFSH